MLNGWRTWDRQDALEFWLWGIVLYGAARVTADAFSGIWHVLCLIVAVGIATVTIAALIAWGTTRWRERR